MTASKFFYWIRSENGTCLTLWWVHFQFKLLNFRRLQPFHLIPRITIFWEKKLSTPFYMHGELIFKLNEKSCYLLHQKGFNYIHTFRAHSSSRSRINGCVRQTDVKHILIWFGLHNPMCGFCNVEDETSCWIARRWRS